MANAQRFRKRPVEIEAVRVSDAMVGAAHLDWLPKWLAAAYERGEVLFLPDGVQISTLEGAMHADRADWIIRGVQGELYPCKPDIFEATYEAVPCAVCANQGWTGNRQTGPGMRHYHCPCGRPCRACGPSQETAPSEAVNYAH